MGGQDFKILGPAPHQYFIPLLGSHQIQNSLIAVTAAQELNKLLPRHISHTQIREGLSRTRWPGRIEVYPGPPLVIVDGAHNPAAAHKLALFIKELKFINLVLIIGIMKDKEIDKICRELVPLASQIILTKPNIARAALPKELLHILQAQSLIINSGTASMVKSVREAVMLAKTKAGPKDIICITGSLYTAGEAKEILDEK